MAFDLETFPHSREVVIDGGYLGTRRHIFHGFLELDVTRARSILKASRGEDGRPLSFTAFVISSLGKAVKMQPAVHAYRDLRGRLVMFREVDVSTLVEPSPGAVAVPRVIRSAESRSVREISEEIRSIQNNPHPWGNLERTMAIGSRLPRIVRLTYLRTLKLNPGWMKKVAGTVIVSSFGMFGRRGGWGIGFLPSHTLGLLVGGIADKPMAYEGGIALRECLHATLSFDHDIVDGAPAARFARTFSELIESASALDTEDA